MIPQFHTCDRLNEFQWYSDTLAINPGVIFFHHFHSKVGSFHKTQTPSDRTTLVSNFGPLFTKLPIYEVLKGMMGFAVSPPPPRVIFLSMLNQINLFISYHMFILCTLTPAMTALISLWTTQRRSVLSKITSSSYLTSRSESTTANWSRDSRLTWLSRPSSLSMRVGGLCVYWEARRKLCAQSCDTNDWVN